MRPIPDQAERDRAVRRSLRLAQRLLDKAFRHDPCENERIVSVAKACTLLGKVLTEIAPEREMTPDLVHEIAENLRLGDKLTEALVERMWPPGGGCRQYPRYTRDRAVVLLMDYLDTMWPRNGRFHL